MSRRHAMGRLISVAFYILIIGLIPSACSAQNAVDDDEDEVLNFLESQIFGENNEVVDLQPGPLQSVESQFINGDMQIEFVRFGNDSRNGEVWTKNPKEFWFEWTFYPFILSSLNIKEDFNIERFGSAVRGIDSHLNLISNDNNGSLFNLELGFYDKTDFLTIFVFSDFRTFEKVQKAVQEPANIYFGNDSVIKVSDRCFTLSGYDEKNQRRGTFLYMYLADGSVDLLDDDDYHCYIAAIARQLELRGLTTKEKLFQFYPPLSHFEIPAYENCVLARIYPKETTVDEIQTEIRNNVCNSHLKGLWPLHVYLKAVASLPSSKRTLNLEEFRTLIRATIKELGPDERRKYLEAETLRLSQQHRPTPKPDHDKFKDAKIRPVYPD